MNLDEPAGFGPLPPAEEEEKRRRNERLEEDVSCRGRRRPAVPAADGRFLQGGKLIDAAAERRRPPAFLPTRGGTSSSARKKERSPIGGGGAGGGGCTTTRRHLRWRVDARPRQQLFQQQGQQQQQQQQQKSDAEEDVGDNSSGSNDKSRCRPHDGRRRQRCGSSSELLGSSSTTARGRQQSVVAARRRNRRHESGVAGGAGLLHSRKKTDLSRVIEEDDGDLAVLPTEEEGEEREGGAATTTTTTSSNAVVGSGDGATNGSAAKDKDRGNDCGGDNGNNHSNSSGRTGTSLRSGSKNARIRKAKAEIRKFCGAVAATSRQASASPSSPPDVGRDGGNERDATAAPLDVSTLVLMSCLRDDLFKKVQSVYTGHHRVVEANGTRRVDDDDDDSIVRSKRRCPADTRSDPVRQNMNAVLAELSECVVSEGTGNRGGCGGDVSFVDGFGRQGEDGNGKEEGPPRLKDEVSFTDRSNAIACNGRDAAVAVSRLSASTIAALEAALFSSSQRHHHHQQQEGRTSARECAEDTATAPEDGQDEQNEVESQVYWEESTVVEEVDDNICENEEGTVYTEYTVDEVATNAMIHQSISLASTAIRPSQGDVVQMNETPGCSDRPNVTLNTSEEQGDPRYSAGNWAKDEDEWSEYTEYTEYTVEESVAALHERLAASSMRSKSRRTEAEAEDVISVQRDAVSVLTPVVSECDDDDYDEYTYVTMAEETVRDNAEHDVTSSAGSSVGPVDDSRIDEGSGDLTKSFTIMLKVDSRTEATHGTSDEEDNESVNIPEPAVEPLLASPTQTSGRVSDRVSELLRHDIWSRDAAVAASALRDLSTHAAEGEECRIYIVQHGGALAIVRAMEVHALHDSVQISACNALRSILLRNRRSNNGHCANLTNSNQLAVLQVGGMRSIIAAMNGHPESLEVQEAACTALARLTECDTGSAANALDKLHADDAVETVVNCVDIYADASPTVSEHGFRALANLCLDHRRRRQELVDHGGLEVMMLALQGAWADQSSKHEAISTLSVLLRSLAEVNQL